MALARIRTIKEAYEIIKETDPDSSLSYFNFRRIVLSGAIPFFKTGNRYLLNYADVEKYFDNQGYVCSVEPLPQIRHKGVIRKIHV
jgi:excisionase family DNA binding protein